MAAAQETIEKLESRLRDAEQVIAALQARQLDAVIGEPGVTLLSYEELANELWQSEEQFRVLLDNLPTAAYTCDPDGLITSYNQKAVDLCGREPALNDPLDGFRRSIKLYDPVGSPIEHDRCRKAKSPPDKREHNGHEIIVERPDGTRRNALAHASPIFDRQGKRIATVIVLVDITQRKQESLARERLAAIVDSSDDAIISKSLDGIIESWNKAAERLYGYTAEEAIGQPISMIVPPDRPDEVPEFLARLRRGERIERCQTVRMRKDGSLVNVSLTISPVRDETGQVCAASAIAHDVTAQKLAQRKLQQSEEQFQSLLASLNEVVWSATLDGQYIYLNDAVESVYGLQHEDCRADKDFWLKAALPEDREIAAATATQLLEQGHSEAEYRIRHTDGSVRWLSDRKYVVKQDGEVVAIGGIAADITGRKQKELQLRVFSQAIENSLDGINITDLAGNITSCNAATAKLYGYEQKELVGRHVDLFNADPDFSLCEIIPAIEQDGGWTGEIEQCKKNGETFPALISTSIVLDEDQHPIGMMGIVRDTTERRRADRALRESEAKLRSVLDSATDFIISIDQDGKLLYVNHLDAEASTDVIGRSGYDFVPADCRPDLQRAMEEVERTRQPFEYETRAVGPKGDFAWYHCRIGPVMVDDRLTGFTMCSTDITAKHKQAVAFSRFDQQFRLMTDHAGDLIAKCTQHGLYMFVSNSCERILGHTANQMRGARLYDFVNPSEVETTKDCYARMVREGLPEISLTYRARHKDGRLVWLESTIRKLDDELAKHPVFVVISRDITERIEFSNKLEVSEKKYRHLVEASHDLIWSVDLEGRITFINQASEKVYGLKPEEMIGRLYSDFVPEHQMEKNRALQSEMQRTGSPPSYYENEVRHSDGSLRVLSANSVLLHDAEGNIIGASGVSRDITEVTKAQAEREAVQQALFEHKQREAELVQQELERVTEELVANTRLATLGKISAQIAHDLRNPLGSVRNAAYYLKGELRSAAGDVREFVELIEGEVETCDTIIRNLLEATRPREPEPQMIDAADLVRSAFQRLHVPEQVELTLQATPDPFYLDFDRVQCRQLIDNLLSNARQAVKPSGWIAVSLESRAGMASIRVRDSGPGVPPAVRGLIFDLLFSTKAKGTGLGLAICRQIVERHGGTIGLEDGEEGGASFLIQIPQGGSRLFAGTTLKQ